MDEDKKKTFMIVIVIVCLVVAGMVLKSTFAPSKPKGAKKPVWLVCTNTGCNAQYSLKQKEFREQMKDDMAGRGMPMGPAVLKCQECGKASAVIGKKCINEQCGSVFVPNYQQGGFPDKCPMCGISAIEQKQLENSK